MRRSGIARAAAAGRSRSTRVAWLGAQLLAHAALPAPAAGVRRGRRRARPRRRARRRPRSSRSSLGGLGAAYAVRPPTVHLHGVVQGPLVIRHAQTLVGGVVRGRHPDPREPRDAAQRDGRRRRERHRHPRRDSTSMLDDVRVVGVELDGIHVRRSQRDDRRLLDLDASRPLGAGDRHLVLDGPGDEHGRAAARSSACARASSRTCRWSTSATTTIGETTLRAITMGEMSMGTIARQRRRRRARRRDLLRRPLGVRDRGQHRLGHARATATATRRAAGVAIEAHYFAKRDGQAQHRRREPRRHPGVRQLDDRRDDAAASSSSSRAPGHPTSSTCPGTTPLEEWTVGAARQPDPRHQPPRRALRRLRRRALRAQGAARAAGAPRVTLLRGSRARACRSSRRSASSPAAASELDAVLITRHLEFSLPYRTLFTGRGVPDLRTHLLNALAELLVRLHLGGFFWGDCSLSNTLFRRDAGALPPTSSTPRPASCTARSPTGSAPTTSTSPRRTSPASCSTSTPRSACRRTSTRSRPARSRARATSALGRADARGGLRRRRALPDRRAAAPAERARLRRRGDPARRDRGRATGCGSTRRSSSRGTIATGCCALTGLDVQENQARRMLNDIARFREALERSESGRCPNRWSPPAGATRSSSRRSRPCPRSCWAALPAAEVFHQVLEHRWFLSEQAGQDVGIDEAVRSYVDSELPTRRPERIVLEASGEEP